MEDIALALKMTENSEQLLDEEGKLQGPNPYDIIKIKAISWHVILELPLGTILALAACFSAGAVLKARGSIDRSIQSD